MNANAVLNKVHQELVKEIVAKNPRHKGKSPYNADVAAEATYLINNAVEQLLKHVIAEQSSFNYFKL